MPEIIASDETCRLIRTFVPSNQDLSDMCAFFSIFCDVTRMKMLSALSIDELCVSDLAALLNLNCCATRDWWRRDAKARLSFTV